ncbi:hypothetical protein Syun_011744 [Stephania yunnanensis]|uniref:Uncharacterized protein n=1 Tax=Stephania yunnanensis TaxID=152371 RepID=A0AAP0PGT4_9MAGN
MYVSKVVFISSIQSKWVSYVESTFDVASDGHYGFQCIALASVYPIEMVGGELEKAFSVNWIKTSSMGEVIGEGYGTIRNYVDCNDVEDVGFEKWSTLPNMCLLIATTFNIMLVNVSCGNCLTYIPLRSSPLSTFRERVIIGVHKRQHHSLG